MQTVTDAENNKTTYVHDGHDRLSQTQYPSATKGAGTSNSGDYEQPTYENTAGGTRTSGTVTALRNRAAEAIGFTVDALGRVTTKNLPGSEPDVTFAYDLLGRMTAASQTGNSLSFTYDALGRNLTQAGPHGTVTSTWDIAGRRTRITHPGGFYVDQDYLVTGETIAIRENGRKRVSLPFSLVPSCLPLKPGGPALDAKAKASDRVRGQSRHARAPGAFPSGDLPGFFERRHEGTRRKKGWSAASRQEVAARQPRP